MGEVVMRQEFARTRFPDRVALGDSQGVSLKLKEEKNEDGGGG